MKIVFIDTNVVIDYLANREPFAMNAAILFELAVNKKIQIFISALSYANIHYILRKLMTNAEVINLLEDVTEMVEIVDVTASIIRQSFKSDFKDYEDGIQYYCALSVPKIEFIVTRNFKDFKTSTYPC